jgi:hypothetical protein
MRGVKLSHLSNPHNDANCSRSIIAWDFVAISL